MALGFNSIGHFFAAMFHDVAVGAKAVEKAAVALAKSETTVENLTALVYPAAVPLERLAYGVFGEVAGVAHATSDAAAANGVSVTLDAATIAEIKKLIAQFPDVIAQAEAMFGVKKA